MVIAVLSLVIGFILLIKGADFFVEGASSIAKRLRIPGFIIGLTIVAFGTSAPELAVSIMAALKGSNDIAVGNVVGSNIFNLLVVLGCSAVIKPMIVQKSMVKKDYPLSVFSAIVLGLLSLDQLFGAPNMSIGRVDGIVLLVCFAGFMYLTINEAVKERKKVKKEYETEVQNMSYPMGKSVLISLLGLAGIVLGGNLSIDGAKEIARFFGLSEALIGLTIVALGTSLPELVTSIVAAKKGEGDIALGNVLGSNIFNIFLILGVSGTILPMQVSSTYIYDIAILIGVCVLVFIPIKKTERISRGLGILMLAMYALYTVYLFVR